MGRAEGDGTWWMVGLRKCLVLAALMEQLHAQFINYVISSKIRGGDGAIQHPRCLAKHETLEVATS
jgi:hypothetical protein